MLNLLLAFNVFFEVLKDSILKLQFPFEVEYIYIYIYVCLLQNCRTLHFYVNALFITTKDCDVFLSLQHTEGLHCIVCYTNTKSFLFCHFSQLATCISYFTHMLGIFISKVHHFALLNFISHFLDRSFNFSRFLATIQIQSVFFQTRLCHQRTFCYLYLLCLGRHLQAGWTK